MLRSPLLAFPLVAACAVQSGTAPTTTSPTPPPGGELAPPAAPPAPPAPRCADADADFPNNLDAPVPLEAASTTLGCITAGDVDLFAVKAPDGAAGTALRFRLEGSAEMAPKIEILDGNRKRVHYQGGGKGEELGGWVHVAGGTNLLLKIDQVHSATDTYTLVLEPVALVEAGEPNEDVAQATSLAEAGTAQGLMSPPANGAGLTDWYKIDVSSAGNLKIDLDMSQEIAVKAELLDGNRKRVVFKGGGRGERVQLEAKVKKGTYYLKLESVHSVDPAGKGDLPPWLTRPYVITTSR
jgi:hypothetical protein